jgi:ech hydrogenase subunit D
MNREPQHFKTVSLAEFPSAIQAFRDEGYRFVQACATTTPEGFGLTYSFDKELALENLHVSLAKGEGIGSISSAFPAAFVFENEMHDLFGIDISGISIDFAGKFYTVSMPSPMAVDTSAKEQKGGRF